MSCMTRFFILNDTFICFAFLQISKRKTDIHRTNTISRKTYFRYFYYNLIGYPKARCYLYAPDYKYLKKTKEIDGLLYWDYQMNAYCIRRFEPKQPFSVAGNVKVERVKLKRSSNSIGIDNRYYVIETLSPLQQKSQAENEAREKCKNAIGELHTSLENLRQVYTQRTEAMLNAENLFVSKEDSKHLAKYAEELNKRIEELDVKIINATQLTNG